MTKIISEFLKKKTHAYLQTISKTPLKFQKDRHKTVGGVAGTRYLLQIRNHTVRTTHHRKPKTMSLLFSSRLPQEWRDIGIRFSVRFPVCTYPWYNVYLIILFGIKIIQYVSFIFISLSTFKSMKEQNITRINKKCYNLQ